MGLRRLALPDTILGRTLALAAGVVLLLTAINLAIIFLRAPPRDAPVTAYEVARLLEGQAIAKEAGGTALRDAQGPVVPSSQADRWIGEAIARHLGVPKGAVGFRHTGSAPEGLVHIEGETVRAHQLYPPSKFDPVIFNDFEVTARLAGGRTRLLVRDDKDAGWSWQLSTALRMLLAFFLVLPVVWLFARALALPIRAFASAADRVGREPSTLR